MYEGVNGRADRPSASAPKVPARGRVNDAGDPSTIGPERAPSARSERAR